MAKEQKNKKDVGRKIVTKVLAIILALMMVLSIAATLIFYIIGR